MVGGGGVYVDVVVVDDDALCCWFFPILVVLLLFSFLCRPASLRRHFYPAGLGRQGLRGDQAVHGHRLRGPRQPGILQGIYEVS